MNVVPEIKSIHETLQDNRKSYFDAISFKATLGNYNVYADTQLTELDHILGLNYPGFIFDFDYYSAPLPQPACTLHGKNSLIGEISFLRGEYHRTKSATILLEISKLIKKLYSSVSLFASRKKSKIKALTRIIVKSAIRDLRLIHRNIVRFLFKNMSDFSGSDNNITFATTKKSCKSLNYYSNEKSYKRKYNLAA